MHSIKCAGNVSASFFFLQYLPNQENIYQSKKNNVIIKYFSPTSELVTVQTVSQLD